MNWKLWIVISCGVCVGVQSLYAQPAPVAQPQNVQSNAQKSSPQAEPEIKLPSHNPLDTKPKGHVPTRFSWAKTALFPLCAVGSPVIFPGYYVFTKEPKLTRSWNNYWETTWIMQPESLDELENKDVSFPKRYSEQIEAEKRKTYIPQDVEKAVKKREEPLMVDPEKKEIVSQYKKIKQKEAMKNKENEKEKELSLAKQKEVEQKKKHREEERKKKQAEATKKAEEKKAKKIQRLTSEVQGALNKGRIERAERLCKEIASLDAHNVNLERFRKEIDVRKKALRAAAENKRKTSEKKEQSADIQKERKAIDRAIHQGKLDKAQQKVTKLLKQYPEDKEIIEQYAIIQQKKTEKMSSQQTTVPSP